MPTPAEFDRLCIVLVAARNPLNIGAAARAMSNFGFLRLRVVNPYRVPFREARSAVGASVLLTAAEEYKSVADALADCGLVVGPRRLVTGNCASRCEGCKMVRASLTSNLHQAGLPFCSVRRNAVSRMTTSVTVIGSCASRRAKRTAR